MTEHELNIPNGVTVKTNRALSGGRWTFCWFQDEGVLFKLVPWDVPNSLEISAGTVSGRFRVQERLEGVKADREWQYGRD